MLPERLDFEGADDDQLDLFYLVDRVLDEIELAKQAAAERRDENIEANEDSNMSTAIHEFDDTSNDLMEQLEMYSDQSFSPQSSFYEQKSATQMQHIFQQHSDNMMSPDDVTQTLQPEMEIAMQMLIRNNEFNYPNNDYLTHTVNEVLSSLNEGSVKSENNDSITDIAYFPDVNGSYPEVTKYDVESEIRRFPESDEDSNDTYCTDMKGWTRKHPESWTSNDVLDWLSICAERIADTIGGDPSKLKLEIFGDVTGDLLCKMGPDEFFKLDPTFGPSFYEMFRSLINDGASFTHPSDLSHSESDTSYNSQPDHHHHQHHHHQQQQQQQQHPHQSHHHHSHQHQHPQQQQEQQQQQQQLHLSQQYHSPTLPEYDTAHQYTGSVYPSQIHPNTSPEMYPAYFQFEYGNQSVQVTSPSSVESIISQGYPGSLKHFDSYSNYAEYYRNQMPTDVTSIRAKYEHGITPMRRRPGRPRTKTVQTEAEMQAQREKKLKNKHLSDFIYELLNDPVCNPSVLKWENQANGIFRFIQSDKVAKLWGDLKGNVNMNYEKLSRAMRHYYKKGIMERVEGRRLVYKYSLEHMDKMREKYESRTT